MNDDEVLGAAERPRERRHPSAGATSAAASATKSDA
jgi:hypothetical protein